MTISGDLWLRLARLLPAPRDEVWGAMTDPARLARWFGPQGFACPSVEFEPRVGNIYRIAMQPPEGELFHLHGTFREVEEPSRLAYTFNWEPPDPDDRETLATLILNRRGAETEVQLMLGEFGTENRLSVHEAGWSESLDRLAGLLR